jgi:glycosyltransferase involved in cell wall biosynthesis
MRLLFLNRFPFHETFAARLIDAANAHDVVYLGGSTPTSDTNYLFTRIRTEMPRWRGVVPPVRAYLLDRRDRHGTWRGALAETEAVIDLFLERTLWALPASGAQRRVRILHRSHGVDRTRDGHGRVKVRRARLCRAVQNGDIIVVHTEYAKTVLREFLPSKAVRCVPHFGPLPVTSARSTRSDRPRLLFVGDGRYEKGFDLLLNALERAAMSVELVHVGGPVGVSSEPQGLERQVGKSIVTRTRGRVTDEELRSYYRTADLVVCPYRPSFVEAGSASMVISEALAYGTPMVLSQSLATLLPQNFGGAITVPDEDAAALAEAIEQAIDELSSLAKHAAVEGPEYADTHGPDAYLAELLVAVGS